MSSQFTERAKKVVLLAEQEARRFNHPYVGTEHLLLGMVLDGEGVAARVLDTMGIKLPTVRATVEFIIGRGEGPVSGEIGFTPRAKKVIELAVDESRCLGHHYIGTEHILLGLVREGEGIAAGVLESLGVNLEKVRQKVLKVVRDPLEPSYVFTKSEMTSFMELLNAIPLFDVLLMEHELTTIPDLLRIHQQFKVGVVNKALQRDWLLEAAGGWLGAIAQSYYESIGKCPGLPVVFAMARGFVPASGHVTDCVFCSSIFNGVVQERSTKEESGAEELVQGQVSSAVENEDAVTTDSSGGGTPSESADSAEAQEAPAAPTEAPPATEAPPTEVKRRRRKKAEEEDSSSIT